MESEQSLGSGEIGNAPSRRGMPELRTSVKFVFKARQKRQ